MNSHCESVGVRVRMMRCALWLLLTVLLEHHTTEGRFRVTADLNTYTSEELLFAANTWRLNGTWTLANNSAWNGTATTPSEQQWHNALSSIGPDVYSEQKYAATAHSAGECGIVRRLSARKHLDAAFVYHETGTQPHTMLSWDEITNVSRACGCNVIGHTRLFKGAWRTQVDQVIQHPNLTGVAIEIDITRYSASYAVFGQGGPFATSILAHGKQPFFLLAFKGDGLSHTGMPAAQQMQAFLGNISNEGADLSDERVNIVVARYGPSAGLLLPVSGQGHDTVSAAIAAAQAEALSRAEKWEPSQPQ